MIDLIKNVITGENGLIIYENPEYIFTNTYFDQMSYFINYIQSNTKSMNSIDESIEVLKICLKNA